MVAWWLVVFYRVAEDDDGVTDFELVDIFIACEPPTIWLLRDFFVGRTSTADRPCIMTMLGLTLPSIDGAAAWLRSFLLGRKGESLPIPLLMKSGLVDGWALRSFLLNCVIWMPTDPAPTSVRWTLALAREGDA